MHRQPTTVVVVRPLIDPVAKGDGVIAPDDLPEVARSCEPMMQATVDYHIQLPAGFLAVHDPRDIDTGLADQVTAELETCVSLRELRPDLLCQQSVEVSAIGARSSRSSLSKYGIPKPPPRFR